MPVSDSTPPAGAGDHSAPVAVHVFVTGRVQGVWYRESCATIARSAGVNGWIRNLPDGRVEAWFEGGRSAVDGVLSWCRHGPRRADVTGLILEDRAVSGAVEFVVE
jgi:acylphosphatase